MNIFQFEMWLNYGKSFVNSIKNEMLYFTLEESISFLF